MNLSEKFLHGQSYMNHLQVFYNNSREAFRSSASSLWSLQIGPSQRPAGDWRVELGAAALQIQHAAGVEKEIILYVDGSYFSQIMISAFHCSQVAFRCVLPRFEKDLNLAAISQAVIMLEEYEVPYEFQAVNVQTLVEDKQSLEWAHKYATDRLDQMVAMSVWKAKQTERSHFVFPYGFLNINIIQEGWMAFEQERDYGIMLFQNEHRFSGTPCFFKWSPELMASLCKNRIIHSIVTNQKKALHLDDFILKEVFQEYFKVFGSRNLLGFERCEFLEKKFSKELEKSNFIKSAAFSIAFADFYGRLQFQAPRPPLKSFDPKKNVG